MSKRRCKGSIANMNSIGERGSPCRRPLKCLNHKPFEPLRRTDVELVAKSIDTQEHHLGGKPNCCRTSRRKSQRTLSKAFAMSNLRKRPGCFVLCKSLMKFWVYKKLSWMLRLLMKALWDLEIIVLRCMDSLVASSLENNFAIECQTDGPEIIDWLSILLFW